MRRALGLREGEKGFSTEDVHILMTFVLYADQSLVKKGGICRVAVDEYVNVFPACTRRFGQLLEDKISQGENGRITIYKHRMEKSSI